MKMLKLSRLPMALLALTIAAPVGIAPGFAGGRPESTFNQGSITYSPPGHIPPLPFAVQQPTPTPPPPPESTGGGDQYGNGGVPKVNAHK
jgi:hypothetical protein